MAQNLVEKILSKHLVSGTLIPGEEIGIRIDQTLTQDATGTMAYLQFESMNMPKVKTELSVSYVDHNTIQIGFENADDQLYLQTVAQKYGMVFSRAGNGICHQIHLERFGKPGKTLIGSDSHTPTCGALSMIAIGAGGLDVALAMAGKPFYLVCPKVIKINLTGKLKPWISAKDVILKVLEIFSTKGNVNTVFEYGGKGVESLTIPERATIANMGAECGVTTSVFPSDKMTRLFLRSQHREKDFVELKPDKDAKYVKVVNIDLSKIEPLTAKPHSPDNISTVKKMQKIDVHQVCLGSCTNSSYKDLVTVAKILKGKTVHPNVSFILAPGSRQVLKELSKNGYLTDLISSGARLMENACGFCIGNSQSPSSAAVSLRTSNRNFQGRSGTMDANVYLVSPETAAAAVITGKFTDPRDLKMRYPKVTLPKKFSIDDTMIIRPDKKKKDVEVIRGPNIGILPRSPELSDTIHGPVTIKVGDKITTDHIIPAGARMKYRSNIPKYSEFVFENVDATFAKRAMSIRQDGKQNIIVAGHSYGQGSSREHAALCPMYLGVRVVIAKSFERIHTANLINFGIIPLTFCSESDYDIIEMEDLLEITETKKTIAGDGKFLMRNKTKGTAFYVTCDLSERQKQIILAGGALNINKA
ncbi:MAG: aconitate hydratase [Deltaproteobacteria bacterium]|jgi:aconitate hydratase|nr:aconitate hydratase [Smithella sp.]NMC96673.1 aconitate hydratase [Deltaproteobacteria bacterium]HOG09577.1 aconitate hydratase [Smithella sp.]HOS13640.1 aconitate hydratase [Smithella sp.]HPL47964.1 aconitate hydratase [Smithella sp.]